MPNFSRLADVARILKATKQTGRSFHVAFILKGRKVIAVGFNNFNKSNHICRTYKPTRVHGADYRACLHAEIDAAAKMKHRDSIKGLIMVSLRIDNKDRIAYAEPCPNCAFHLGKWGYNNIFYSTDSGQFKRVGY
jgi:deoxycytidylate deaminase